MKRFFIMAAVAAAVLSLAGCNDKWNGGKLTYSVRLLVSAEDEDVTNGVTTVTQYDWRDSDAAPVGQVCSVGDKKVYEDSSYSYAGSTITYYRQYYENGNPTTREKRVAKYTSPDWSFMWSLEIFSEGNDTTPIESMVYTLDEYWQISKYEHKKDGVVVLKNDNYDYEQTSTTYDISENDGAKLSAGVSTYRDYTKRDILSSVITERPSNNLISRTDHSYVGESYTGYETKVPGTSEQDMLVVEKMDNVVSTGTNASYTTTQYDLNGTTTSTVKTKKVYKIMTVTM